MLGIFQTVSVAGVSLFLTTSICFPTPTHATILVPDDQPTIQSALNVASSGETIIVSPGTYFESRLNFHGKDLILVSAGGPDLTVINGGGSGPVFTLSSTETRAAVIEGFTITNGLGSANFEGGGLLISSGSSPTVRNNKITGNVSQFAGGGIKIDSGSNPLVERNQISNNTAAEQGAGIHVISGAATIIDNTITGNQVTGIGAASPPGGGGIKSTYSTDVHIISNVITNNSAPFTGGGISAFGSDVEIRGNEIRQNQADNGGGVHLETQVNNGGDRLFDVRDNSIRENTARTNGGGIHSFLEGTTSTALIVGNLVSDNQCHESTCSNTNGSGCCKGGGLSSIGGVTPGSHIVKNNRLTGNSADVYGAGIFDNSAAYPSSMNLTFVGNEVADNTTKFNYPGVSCIDTQICRLERNSFFWNSTLPEPADHNTVRNPGGIYIKNSQSSWIENNFFFENSGSQAGAIFILGGVTNTGLVHNTFADNVTGAATGGTVRVESGADFIGNIFSGDHHAVRVSGSPVLSFDTNDFHGQSEGIVVGGPTVDTVAALNAESYASGNLEVVPGFLDPDLGLYRLSSASALLGAAPCGKAPLEDIDGDPRPLGNGCDIGADELHVDTVGLFVRDTSTFHLHGVNAAGPADATFRYGPVGVGWIPVIGDWNGDRVDTIGLYDPNRSMFFLRNANSSGVAEIAFRYGPAAQGWLPLVGDWDGDGIDSVGLFDPTRNLFLLRNSNSAGSADLSFQYGPAGSGWTPVSGDWDGNDSDGVGLYDPVRSLFLLKNSNSAGSADLSFNFGSSGSGWASMAGDWDGELVETVGLYDAARSMFFLKNTNSGGSADMNFVFGPRGASLVPLSGRWGL